jgi:hypothetical protein
MAEMSQTNCTWPLTGTALKSRRLICGSTRAVINRRGGPHWRAGAVVALAWLLLSPGLGAAVQDRREAIAQESQRYRAQHFPDGHMPPKHGWKQQSFAQPAVTEPREVPGGVGYGYYFYKDALLWTNSSIADYYVVAPTYPGQDVDYLYLTSTCRAQLGTESLVAYENEDEAQFWIYDWSLPTNNRWRVFIDLPTDNPQYLTIRPDEFAVTRQMVHVRNGTYYLGITNGLYNWQNQTLLFDFVRGDWDYIYSYNYTTTKLTNNIPVAGGEPSGFWGPIVETFQTYTNVNPVGFDLIRLFQDGNANPSWLTPANSYGVELTYTNDGITAATNWNLLSQASNTSFTVSVGGTNLIIAPSNSGTLCVTVNTNVGSFSLIPSAGLFSPYWIITPYSNRWDNTVVGLSPGTATIVNFNPVPGLATPAQQSVNILGNGITTVQAIYGTNQWLVADSPIGVFGYNLDVVVENTATGGNTAGYAQPFDAVARTAFYESGLGDIGFWAYGDGSEGLPQSGFFTSILDGVTTFQLGPYTANNVLYMTQFSPSATLFLALQNAYDSVSVLAASANGGGYGSFVINFTDGTSSPVVLNYGAADCLSSSPNAALTGFGLAQTGNSGAFYTQDTINLPNLYQTSFDLRALGLNAKPIFSFSFSWASGTNVSAATVTGVFALSGTVAVAPPAFQSVERTDQTIQFTWNAAASRAYQVQYTTNLAQTNWSNLGGPITATNIIASSSAAITADPARFYRVILLP